MLVSDVSSVVASFWYDFIVMLSRLGDSLYNRQVLDLAAAAKGTQSKMVSDDFRRCIKRLVSTNNCFRSHEPMEVYLQSQTTMTFEEIHFLVEAFHDFDPINRTWQGSVMAVFIDEMNRMALMPKLQKMLRPIAIVFDRAVGWSWIQKKATDTKDKDFVWMMKDALVVFSQWCDWEIIMEREGEWEDDIQSLFNLRQTYTGDLMLSKEFGYTACCEFIDYYCKKALQQVLELHIVHETDLMKPIVDFLARCEELKLHTDLEKKKISV